MVAMITSMKGHICCVQRETAVQNLVIGDELYDCADELSTLFLVQSVDFSQEELSKLCENKVELETLASGLHTQRPGI